MATKNACGLFWFTLGLALAACNPAKDEPQENDWHLVPEGKADNYYSNLSREFMFVGWDSLPMTQQEFADPTRRDPQIAQRISEIGAYLSAYLTAKRPPKDANHWRHDNYGYGDFHTTVRLHSGKPGDLFYEDGITNFEFSFYVAGPDDLISHLSATPGAEFTNGHLYFTLKLPANVDRDDFWAPYEIAKFDPARYPGELETLEIEVSQQERPQNAYPEYRAFFADSIFDVTLFYGHDSDSKRNDLKDAAEAFDRLVKIGFSPPVGSFEKLKANSGSFYRRIRANWKNVIVQVRLFHSDMFKGKRAAQKQLAMKRLAESDVFIYDGHHGALRDLDLGPGSAATIYAKDFLQVPFSASRKQLFFANGCQTYAQFADALYAHPAKNEKNLDVITTVNFGHNSGTTEVDFVENLLRTDDNKRHQPVDYNELLSELDGSWLERQAGQLLFDRSPTVYGVIGIEDNSGLHPYANLSQIGRECERDTDCGDPDGNRCVDFDLSLNWRRGRSCTALALYADECPKGLWFGKLATDFLVRTAVCYE